MFPAAYRCIPVSESVKFKSSYVRRKINADQKENFMQVRYEKDNKERIPFEHYLEEFAVIDPKRPQPVGVPGMKRHRNLKCE